MTRNMVLGLALVIATGCVVKHPYSIPQCPVPLDWECIPVIIVDKEMGLESGVIMCREPFKDEEDEL